jgi:hypothetical protein
MVLERPRYTAFEKKRIDRGVYHASKGTQTRRERRSDVSDLMEIGMDPGFMKSTVISAQVYSRRCIL